MQKYSGKMAYKITLPINQSITDVEFKFLPFESGFSQEEWIQNWEGKDGYLFVIKILEKTV